jgi:hypothetical protein
MGHIERRILRERAAIFESRENQSDLSIVKSNMNGFFNLSIHQIAIGNEKKKKKKNFDG